MENYFIVKTEETAFFLNLMVPEIIIDDKYYYILLDKKTAIQIANCCNVPVWTERSLL